MPSTTALYQVLLLDCIMPYPIDLQPTNTLPHMALDSSLGAASKPLVPYMALDSSLGAVVKPLYKPTIELLGCNRDPAPTFKMGKKKWSFGTDG